MRLAFLFLFLFLVFFGCDRPGAVVVQYDVLGKPMMCWELTGLTPAQTFYGLQWRTEDGSILTVTGGVLNWVRVYGDRWDEAYETLGLTRQRCRESVMEW